MTVQIDESEWARIKQKLEEVKAERDNYKELFEKAVVERRSFIGLLRGYRHIANVLMRATAFHHAATAPDRPFWEFIGLTENQYRWWENDLIEGKEYPLDPKGS